MEAMFEILLKEVLTSESLMRSYSLAPPEQQVKHASRCLAVAYLLLWSMVTDTLASSALWLLRQDFEVFTEAVSDYDGTVNAIRRV